MFNLSENKYSLHIFIIIILLVLSFFTIAPVLNMILLGAMIAYGIRPVAGRIQYKLKYPSISIILAMIVVVIPLILLFGYIFWEISNFATMFLASNTATSGSDLTLEQGITNLVQSLPVDAQLTAQNFLNSLSSYLQEGLSYLLRSIVNLVKSFSNVIIQLFVLFCSIYYFAKDGDSFWDYLFAFIPDTHKEFFDKTIDEIANVLKSIFYGHFLTAVIIGIMGGVGYALLGYKFALLLGVITGVLQLIPIFGPWPVYWTLAAYDVFVTGNILQAVLTILWGFVLSLSDMYIRPALAGKYADIHSLILLVGFMAGPYVFGIVGFILGPLILGITYAVIKSLKEELENLKLESD
ncbi:Predicted PurR-regulated permease PerM [Methanobrevibacter olleyae]|uniref:Predicted PurR-regulated permease PerM n=1 Tax=Methanobrevibacter olleyae TaxID=294671 RepID=A0A1I4FIV4_METOL|nr:AI-2E family transporter [Methanobrevibacter olleyae]SFL16756.1 Predicted PurR-regulated permease PerM [Methanobrevibacter olleyae]